jgi:deoxyinosine 3'endonuclease (endonuclease V)
MAGLVTQLDGDTAWLQGLEECSSGKATETASAAGSRLQLVAGLDISFFPPADKDGRSSPMPTSPARERAVAALAVLSFPDLQLTHLEVMELRLGVPYLSGLLGFR